MIKKGKKGKKVEPVFHPVVRDERYKTKHEKASEMLFDGYVEDDTDEFGDKTMHGFLGRRRG